MPLTIGEIAEKLRISIPEESAKKPIHGVASLGEAGPEEISFFADPRYASALRRTKAAAVLVPENFSESIGPVLLPCGDPGGAFAEILQLFQPSTIEWPKGIHPSASVDPSATVAPGASIRQNVVVEGAAVVGEGTVLCPGVSIGHGAVIGQDCFLHPGVVIGERCILGDRVILQAGVVIGSDGFGYELRDGRQEKIPQTGIVQIDDDVEIGANSTVDRARFGRTHIGVGAKIDNLVQIGHNVKVGPHSILCAQVGISGSTSLGSYVTLAGKVGVCGHIEIGDRAVVGALSGVAGSIPEGEICAGRPPLPIKEYRRNLMQLRKIGKLYDRVRDLEKKLENSGASASD